MAKSKYEDVIGKLEKLPLGEGGEAQNLVKVAITELGSSAFDKGLREHLAYVLELRQRNKNASFLSDAFARNDITEIVKAYASIREEKEAIDALLSEANTRLEAITQVAINLCETKDLSSVRVAGVGTFSTYRQPYVQILDNTVNRKWCIEKGLENKMQLPWMTLNGLASSMLLAGEEPPPGTKLYSKARVRLARATSIPRVDDPPFEAL